VRFDVSSADLHISTEAIAVGWVSSLTNVAEQFPLSGVSPLPSGIVAAWFPIRESDPTKNVPLEVSVERTLRHTPSGASMATMKHKAHR
jgi:hypothetical protein